MQNYSNDCFLEDMVPVWHFLSDKHGIGPPWFEKGLDPMLVAEEMPGWHQIFKKRVLGLISTHVLNV